MRLTIDSKRLWRRGMLFIALALGLSACVYAPPPAGYAYAPSYYASGYYAPDYYYAPSYYYPAPAYYYPPVYGSATFVFGGHHHFH